MIDPYDTVRLDADDETPAVSRALLVIVCGLVAASGFGATVAAYLLW
jgi:hypothetical protein